MSLWQKRLAEEDQQMFINLDEYMEENDLNQQVASIIQQHLQSLVNFIFITQMKKILGMEICG